MQAQAAANSDNELAVNDLGPLAWVLDELRKSLDGATKAIRRFVRDAELARGSDLESLDASQLRIARQQLHQAVGALEMVGLAEPAKVLRAMEALAQKFVQRPEFCSEEAAAKVERASFALVEYLEGVLRGKSASAVALFPQYRDVLELVGEERIHPAELWPHAWRWIDVELPGQVDALAYEPAVRAQMDGAVLKLVKTGSVSSAQQMRDICLGLAAMQKTLESRSFWKICAAYFEALALKLCPPDVYVKRAASRVLMQYSTLARGSTDVSERLAQDLLFFCSQSMPEDGQAAPVLSAVRQAYGLAQSGPVNYETTQFGRFDPALLVQTRKRIATATETWSALSGGDTNRLKVVAEQFGVVSESLLKLHPENSELARALLKAVDVTVRSGEPPSTPLAMEVATAILYLDAAYEDMDPTESHMSERSQRLARRLDHVIAGGQPEALEPWMEELYRRVSDRQTMGSVVEELRTSLTEIEKTLDQFFRNPKDKLPLSEVPSQLSQMRGVFSVLGLDQASLATVRMRDSVEKFLVDNIDETTARSGIFEKFGNSLGALGFLIDMLSYQRALAKKLFVYDEELGEFKPLMGREREVEAVAPEPAVAPAAVSPQSVSPAATVGASASAPTQTLAVIEEDDGAELRDIFLEEAREVVGNGLDAVAALVADPADLSQQTTLRRAFHTLKGSSRMVGFTEFGEAGWAMEQMMNNWLAEQKPARPELLQLAGAALQGMGRWGEDIAAGSDAAWTSVPFRASADAMRLESKFVQLVLPVSAEPPESPMATESALEQPDLVPPSTGDTIELTMAEEEPPTPDFASTQMFEFELPLASEPTPEPASAKQHVRTDERSSQDDFGGIDFDSLASVPQVVSRTDTSHQPPAERASGLAVDWAATSLAGPEELSYLAEEKTEVVDWAATSLAGPDELSYLAEEKTEAVDWAATSLAGPDELSYLAEAKTEAVDWAATSLAGPEEMARLEELPDVKNDWADTGTATFELPEVKNNWADTATGSLDVPHEEASETLPGGLEDFELDLTPPPAVSADAADEQVKVIGTLRIGIPLYNVFLNEADEWSRRLVTELNEWALELHQPVPDSGIALAHSLGGSSATVGFLALSEIARALEQAMQHVQLHGQGRPEHAQVFVAAAEDIRHLLHQFAAGFLKAPDAGLLDALDEILKLDFPHRDPVEQQEESVDVGSRYSDREGPSSELPSLDLGDLNFDFSAGEPVSAVEKTESLPPMQMPKLQPMQGAARIVTEEQDDDIDAVDAIDADLFPFFEEEAGELLPQLAGALRQWSGQPDNESARLDVLRVLHTLKGSARLAGAMRLGEMAHRLESAIEQMGMEFIQTTQIDPLLARFDRLQDAFDDLCRGPQEAEVITPINPEPTVQKISEPQPGEMTASLESSPVSPAEVARPVLPAMAPSARLSPVSQAAMGMARPASGQSVRVRAQLLDRLVNQAGEVMITRTRLDARLGQLHGSLNELTTNLDRLRTHLRDVEVQAESQMQSRLALAKDTAQGFDPLEFDRFTRVQELTRMMAESVNDVATVQRNLQKTLSGTEDDLIAQGRQTRELQRDLLRTRMLEFEGISERLYGVVRQAAKDAGKQVKLDITGGSLEIDRGVLDRMAPAFEHILRNSVAHGIENPSQRAAAGKPAAGTITIGLAQEGNDVSVTFSDDGAGLDLARIREKAVEKGLAQPGQALTDAEAANMIFMPGFSTATSVTELSGRGIGMDVVRSEVQALGGRIETATQGGVGSSFKLVLPLTTAVTQVIMLRMGELTLGVPANLVELVRRPNSQELEQAYQTGRLAYGDDMVPFFWAGALLQASSRSSERAGKTHPVVVFRSAGQRLAAHVDEVLGNQEVVVKNLGPQLSRLPGLAGMSVLASGAVVLIYNPVALATVYGEKAYELQTAAHKMAAAGGEVILAPGEKVVTPGTGDVPLVLVVDDSITVRRVTQRLLRREGYRVALAADGLQALEQLALERPAVVLSDIEMPRMDGFDLARNIRADASLQGLPIIMITSRIAEKHREHAKELGVNNYLGKPYSEEELLKLVQHYCAQAVPA